LLWKMNRQRLDIEALRDALLAVSGRLDRTMGGPSVKDILSAKGNRRTVYGFLDRLNLPGLYRTFDFPSPDTSRPPPTVTTVAPQALFLMNNPFVLDCARRLLQRPEVAAEKDLLRRVERLYQVVYGRAPSAAERDAAREYLEEAGTTPQAWQSYA